MNTWFSPRLGVALCLSLCAGSPACAPREPPASPTALVFKHGKMTGSPQAMQRLFREFEDRHPGVSVREELLPASTDQQHQFYAINMDSRQVPFDVLAVDVIWVPEFARAGWIRPVDSLLPSSDRRDYFASAIDAATFDGRVYAVPWYIDAGFLYYRRDLLERYGFGPPRTWRDLAHIVKTIRQGERDPALKGFLWSGKQYEGLVCAALEFIWGQGGDILDAATSVESESALQVMRDLVRDGISPEWVSTADEETSRLLFMDGRAIFMRNWSYVWSLLQDRDAPLRDRAGIAPLPSFDGRSSASTLGGWMLAMPTHAARPELAAAFIAFLSSVDVQRRLALELGYHPARRSLYADPSLRRAHSTEVFPVFLTARPRPVTPYYLMLTQVLQPEFSAVLVGRKTPRAALDAINNHMARLGLVETQQPRDRESSQFPESRLVRR